jgi:hypothetical protein
VNYGYMRKKQACELVKPYTSIFWIYFTTCTNIQYSRELSRLKCQFCVSRLQIISNLALKNKYENICVPLQIYAS